MGVSLMGSNPDKCAWRVQPRTESKPWGEETRWSSLSTLKGKIITIKEGMRTSLKFHVHKNEAFYVLSGRVKFYFADEAWLHFKGEDMNCEILGPGDSVAVQSHCVYRIQAIDDAKIVEISDGSQDQYVRIEDDFERPLSQAKYPNKFKE